MPIYEYKCDRCETVFEVIQKFVDAPLKVHEACGGNLVRLISVSALKFKGSGFYINDYKKSGANGSKSEGAKHSESTSSSPSSTTTDSAASSGTPATPAAAPAATTSPASTTTESKK